MDLSVQFAGLENLLFQEVIKDMNLNENKVFHGAAHLPDDVAAPKYAPAPPAEPALVKNVADEETKVSQNVCDEVHHELEKSAGAHVGDVYHSPSEVYVRVRDHV